MQKKTQSLKLGVLLLILLGIVGTTFAGSHTGTLADSYRSFAVSPSSTACVGNNNSNEPNSDCNTNTPDPSPGSCQLAWIKGGGGTVKLDVSKVTDKGLQQTLKGYNLRCASDVKASSSYTLVPGANDSGNPKLDLANVMNRSPWIYQQLNGKFGLNCDKSTASQNASKQSGKEFYIESALGSLVVDILGGQTKPGVNGIPIIAHTRNNPPTDNQLWDFVPDGKNDKYGYFQSKSGLVLDIKGAKTTTGTPVVAFGKNPSQPDNQLWDFVPDGVNEGYGYIQSKSNLVLNIPTDSSKPLTASFKDQPLSPNQIWIEVSQP